MPSIGDTKYVEKIIDRSEARRLRDVCQDAADDISNASTALGVIAEIFGVPAGVLTTGAGIILSSEFKRLAKLYGLAYDLLSNGKYKNAKMAQKFKYKQVKMWGDYFFGWYACGSAEIVALQYNNGKWINDPNY